MSYAIHVEHLYKKFARPQQQGSGFRGVLKDLFSPKTEIHKAISDLSLAVKKGEKVAFIGPNGAGKSTTLKILTGILYPTSGKVEVLGHIPWEEREQLSYKIGSVFGQRSQLWYHLAPIETFKLLSAIYEIEPALYKKRLNTLIDIFDLHEFLYAPVTGLSLGQRMRAELAASLLHNPEILFLDEPTIGLDLNAKLEIRKFLNALVKEQGTTLFLTSHDTMDIEQVADRVLVLDKGRIVLDSTVQNLKKNYLKKKKVTLVIDEENLVLELPGVHVLPSSPNHFICEVDVKQMPIEKVIQEALRKVTVKDITVEDSSMEEIIREIYAA